ncbi:MAG: acyl-CoA thioesterase domain-containing protein [Sphingorhabdus sp.]
MTDESLSTDGKAPEVAPTRDVNWARAFSTPAGLILGLDMVGRTLNGCHMVCRPVAPALAGVSGSVHPGAVTVMADQCMGSAASGDRPRALVTLDMRIDWFTDPAPGSEVHCRATAAASTGRSVFVTSEFRDSAETLLGTGAAQFMVGVAAGGFTDIYERGASLQKHRAGLSFTGVDSFESYLDIQEEGPELILWPSDRFIGSPFLPALHGGVTAAALREAMWLRARSWQPAPNFHMIGWTTQYLLAGQALKPLRVVTDWIRQGRNIALLRASALQEGKKGPVAIAQASFVALESE